MPEWSTSCVDWADRLRSGRSIIPPPIFPEEAEAGLRVMRELRIVDAPGSPRLGDACNRWIFDLAASIFGAYDAVSGKRLITEWFVLIPKKNFKSGLAAAIMLTSLIRNWRQSAEFTILAPTLEVANNSFGPARDMVQFDEDGEPSELSDLIHVQTHIRTLTHREKNATLKVVATDSATVAGKKSVGTLIDELWLLGKQPNAEAMLREALGGLASRPEGFVIYLTTQSDEPPTGVFKKKLQYARQVRDGKVHDPSFVPVIFEHPPAMVERKEHLLLENIAMVNPNLGASVGEEFLHREYRKAKEEGDESFRGFMAKHANVEIGISLGSDRWTGADFWEACGRALSLDQLLERCDVIEIGVDGGGLDDMLGFAALGRDADTGRWLLWSHAWIHPIALDRRQANASVYRDFAADGDLTICAAVGDDVREVGEIVDRIWTAGLGDRVGVDPVGIGAVVDELIERGVPQDAIVGISQGWKMAGAIKTVERKLAEGELEHGGTRLMAWCVGNCRVEPRGNAITITKQTAGLAKIDPVAALFNAAALMALNPAPRRLGASDLIAVA